MSASAVALDLDCLIAAHDKFLDIVLTRALLGPGKAEGLRRNLNQLLRTCMSLAPMVQRFCEKVNSREFQTCSAGGAVAVFARAMSASRLAKMSSTLLQ